MSIPNLVYKSLHVRYTVFSTIANFVSDDVGACCNSCLGASCNNVTVEQIVHIRGVNRANYLLLNLKDSYFEPAVGSPPNFARMCGYRPY